MATTVAERMGGGERTGRGRGRDDERTKTGGSDATGLYEGDSAEDELATLMPTLKRQFEAFDDNEGTLNFMGEVNMANNEESYRHDYDKENVVSDHDSFQLRRSRDRSFRQGSGRVTTNRPIDYSKLFAMNRTLVSPPSGSLYKNTTLALKEKPVNKSRLQSKNVDDFWLTEREKKISAVARRKLAGIKTPAKTIPKVVEDRHARHARSRRGGGNSRILGKRPIKFDLYLDAAKISEWDQEALAEEEVAPSTRSHSGTFMSTGRRRALHMNLSDLDEKRKEVAVQPGALRDFRLENEIQGEEEGNEPKHPSEAPQKADSPISLPDMDCSAGESPLVVVEDFSGREKQGQNRLQNPGSACPESLSPSPGRSQSLREGAGSAEISKGDPPPTDSNNIKDDPSLTPCKGFPVLESSNLHPQRSPVTSPPTPPSNPVAVYMSLTHLEGDVRQRRLSFISSPSKATSATSESGGGQEEQKTDFGEVESPKDLCPGIEQLMTITKEDVQGEECLLSESESRRDISDCERDQMLTSKGDAEARDPPFCDRVKEINDEVRTQKLQAAEAERQEMDSPGKHLSCSEQCDDAKPCQDQIFSSGACIPPPGENALLAISQDYPDDEDLELPADLKESEPAPHKSNGISLPQQPEPTIPVHNNEESVDDVAVENNKAQILAEALNEIGDREEALPCVTQQNCAAAEGVIGTDESSTTETKSKLVKKRARKAKENRRFSLQDSGTIWKDGQRRSQRIRVRALEWWRGEKLLYGRIHESLTTVIGIKHSSPGKYACGIQEPFVVESYVPAKYSELVRFAAI